MTAARKKAAPVKPPRDAAEAAGLLGQLGEIRRKCDGGRASLDRMISALSEALATDLAPLLARAAEIESALRAWAEANREALTRGGRTKTVKLVTGEVAWRVGPARLRVEDEAAAVRALIERGRAAPYLRVATSLDRAALLKDRPLAASLPGVAVEPGREEVVVKPLSSAGERAE